MNCLIPGFTYKQVDGFEILDLDVDIVSSFYKLPKIKNKQSFSANKDPFDRMLAWQAIQKDCCLLTRDSAFAGYKDYGLKVIW